ncbi:uncharacterized protein [Primulina eburnea]|uniref:uncharacterized protein n=1 Tax=Primulina eburnea TaxID=1245227 RepID=UPI003C6CB08A
MDEEEIAKRVSSLKLSLPNLGAPVVIPTVLAAAGSQRLESCLVAKVFSSKAVNRETFRTQMPRIIQAKKEVKIEVIGENMFMLNFNSIMDKRNVMLGGPWNFFKDLVIFKEPTGLQKTMDINFDELAIWVQCHNLPFAFMHESVIRNLGERIGRVLEVDGEEDGNCTGKFVRVRVLLDITKPLLQGLRVKPEEAEEEICILLLYERLPNFCYLCGRLGHVLKECVDHRDEDPVPSYGNWLRASSISGNRIVKEYISNIPSSSDSPHFPPQGFEVGSEEHVGMNVIPLHQKDSSEVLGKSFTDENLELPMVQLPRVTQNLDSDFSEKRAALVIDIDQNRDVGFQVQRPANKDELETYGSWVSKTVFSFHQYVFH